MDGVAILSMISLVVSMGMMGFITQSIVPTEETRGLLTALYMFCLANAVVSMTVFAYIVADKIKQKNGALI